MGKSARAIRIYGVKCNMRRRGKITSPMIYFVTQVGKKGFSFSQSSIYSKRELLAVDTNNIVNETGLPLEIGDKIVAYMQQTNGASQFIIKNTIAKHQPIADSEKEYFRSLQICVDDKSQTLDFQELNSILEKILGITVNRPKANSIDYHLVIDLSGEDKGTKHCPFVFSSDSGSYPLKVNFPQVSDRTKRYLRMIFPHGRITNTWIFAFRLIHFLLHRLGYPEHFDDKKIEEKKKTIKALQEGDPSQMPFLDFSEICLCDWEFIHFLAIQPNLMPSSYNKMLCNGCRKKLRHIGVGLEDLMTLFGVLREYSEPHSQVRTEKHIFYVVEARKDGLVFNESPYKARTSLNIKEEDWIETIFATRENLHNIFIPTELFDRSIEVELGDKVLMQVQLESKLSNESHAETCVKSAKIDKFLKKSVKIINPHSLLSKIRPFRLGVTLRIGPDTDLDFVKRVAKIVRRLTHWQVEIDKSSYNDLRNSYLMLNNVREKWEKADLPNKGTLISEVHKIIEKLPKKIDVEDSFRVIVYIFPEEYAFLEDVFGTMASGLALHRTFAAVSVFPSVPSEYAKKEPCRNCESKVAVPFREEITSLFVIHEVLHIASGLEDHRNCPTCAYRRKEMLPFRRSYCEECIREGNDQTHENCLMSYECLICISTRLLPERKLSDFLCEKCEKKLLPEEQFAARQAARMNFHIYRRFLMK